MKVEKQDIPAKSQIYIWKNSCMLVIKSTLAAQIRLSQTMEDILSGRSWRIQNVKSRRSDRILEQLREEADNLLWIQGTERRRYGVWRGPHARGNWE